MTIVTHCGREFSAKGNTVLTEGWPFVFDDDVIRIASKPEGLLVETERREIYLIQGGPEPMQMFAQLLPNTARIHYV